MTNIEKAFFALIRVGINPKSEFDFDFSTLSNEDWTDMSNLASAQGVFSFLFDAFQYDAIKKYVPRTVFLELLSQVILLEQTTQKKWNALSHLTKTFLDDNVQTLLLKGLGLSLLYPKPNHRDGTDIDIYLMGDYKKGNHIISSLGIDIDSENQGKHSTFFFDNYHVENHYTFLSRGFSKSFSKCDDELHLLLNTDAPKEYHFDNTSILLPSETFNALFLICHATMHVICGEGCVRHLCDLSVFFSRNYHKVDQKRLFELLSAMPMFPIIQMVLSLSIDLLGMKKSCLLPDFYSSEIDKKQMTLEYFLYYNYAKEQLLAKKTFFSIKKGRYKLMKIRRKYYNTITGKEFMFVSSPLNFIRRSLEFFR